MVKVSVIVPVFDPGERIDRCIESLLGQSMPAGEYEVVFVDDGSTDGTGGLARTHGADVLSFGENRGLRAAIPAGYAQALERGYAYCGRVDADGQHPAAELVRLLALVRDNRCDVAVGSRFVSGDGYAAYRYRPSPVRRLGTAVLRRAMALALGRPFGDATSGLYAVNAKALPLLAEPFTSRAPEVEALIRLAHAGLRVEEVPVNMADRASGESKLRGGKAVKLVLTVAGTLLLARLLRARR
jgi:glycosyltransferase involved in cell wall biosynthesis